MIYSSLEKAPKKVSLLKCPRQLTEMAKTAYLLCQVSKDSKKTRTISAWDVYTILYMYYIGKANTTAMAGAVLLRWQSQ